MGSCHQCSILNKQIVIYIDIWLDRPTVLTLKGVNITVMAVLVVRDIAHHICITATGPVIPAPGDTHVTVTDEALKTLAILVAATEVFSSLIATGGMSVRTVGVRAAS